MLFGDIPGSAAVQGPHLLAAHEVGAQLAVYATFWPSNCIVVSVRHSCWPLACAESRAEGYLPCCQVPFGYCWSEALIPKPADWGQHIDVVGLQPVLLSCRPHHHVEFVLLCLRRLTSCSTLHLKWPRCHTWAASHFWYLMSGTAALPSRVVAVSGPHFLVAVWQQLCHLWVSV